ncbi:lipopolysaccharide biosynthesis protein [Homoserinibacter gongjuensis]|uniref:Polysaccharide biosynthesis protein C-terminal domain-containing protein n=1 Tax=Homoserinibacter gongjuensis TaxID=1162968 RepID=A0ABQ6JRL0_9MICO|nr:hypothetical protein [Homoserinibacter gongjuensis]GMA90033.1 hypothetical protein GCM10025869_05620 [Homoserinibacter gongjuensis]
MTEPVGVPPALGGRRALARRVIAFAGVPFLSLLAPFLFLPVLARLAGADAWVAIAVGQSVGGFAALVAGLGYATLAPPLVAVALADERRRILATSVHARLPAWVVAGAVGVVVSVLLAPESARVEAGAMAGAMSLAALAPTWYWIGVGRALPILWSEVLPRMVATLAATGILLAGGGAIWYPVLLAVAMFAGPAVIYLHVAGRELGRVVGHEVAAVLRTHPPLSSPRRRRVPTTRSPSRSSRRRPRWRRPRGMSRVTRSIGSVSTRCRRSAMRCRGGWPRRYPTARRWDGGCASPSSCISRSARRGCSPSRCSARG